MASSDIPEGIFFESIYGVLKVDETRRPLFQRSAEEVARKFAPANELQAYNIDFRAESLALQFVRYHGIELLGFPTNSFKHLSETEASNILTALGRLFGRLLETSVAADGVDLAISEAVSEEDGVNAITKSMRGAKLDQSEEAAAQGDPQDNGYVMEEMEDPLEPIQGNGVDRVESGTDHESGDDGTVAQDPEDKTNEVAPGESDDTGRYVGDEDGEPKNERDEAAMETTSRSGGSFKMAMESKDGDGRWGIDEGNGGNDVGDAVDEDEGKDENEVEVDKECPFFCGAFFSDFNDLQEHVDKKHPPEDWE